MRLNLIQKTRKNVTKTRFDYVNGFPDHEIEGYDHVEALSCDVGGELICDADDDGKYKDRKGNGMETTIVVDCLDNDVLQRQVALHSLRNRGFY